MTGGPHNADGRDSWAKGGNCGYQGTTTGPSIIGQPGQQTIRRGVIIKHQQIYIVRKGDTLFGIAAHFRVDPMAIAHANGIVNPNLIFVGERLIIP